MKLLFGITIIVIKVLILVFNTIYNPYNMRSNFGKLCYFISIINCSTSVIKLII